MVYISIIVFLFVIFNSIWTAPIDGDLEHANNELIKSELNDTLIEVPSSSSTPTSESSLTLESNSDLPSNDLITETVPLEVLEEISSEIAASCCVQMLPCCPTQSPQSKFDANQILKKGEKIGQIATGILSAPIVLLSSTASAAAGALPPLLAAKGALIGQAIAKPLQLIIVSGSGLASGATGFLVGTPIALGSAAAAQGQVLKDLGFNAIDWVKQNSQNGMNKINSLIPQVSLSTFVDFPDKPEPSKCPCPTAQEPSVVCCPTIAIQPSPEHPAPNHPEKTYTPSPEFKF